MCVGEKVKNLSLYVSSTFQCDSCNGILKHIMGCNALTPTWAMQQMDTQIIDGMTTLALYRMWHTEMNMECFKKMGGG
jgi:hypothetical protein